MSRGRSLVVGALAAALLAAATTAPPVELWRVPNSSGGRPSLGAAPSVVVDSPRSPTEAGSERGKGLGVLMQFLAVGVAAAGMAAAFAMRGWWSGDGPSRGGRFRRGRRFAVLPEVPAPDVGVDLAGALEALSRGRPRNAIVACWMRLERDIAEAGWPRDSAETSAEYVERIVADASVDPSAISDLAALYREARFSNHELPDEHRARAFDALSRVEAALRGAVRASA